ncbi:Wzz/FepE/Etk N-terminal domain-containing protein [Hydrocarboniclastica marina]|uniref:Polysaccharide chain length determinant N-terminal domain-containing protein n=1 Tax=Hydrocarboniclastica marina TaxID=2259620 RepID=A0A4P7XID9_9ALTE|nr:Wzz/FepE/Etk N-terminal domain-containing protein [Hydrocarboniclastica marina]MAM00611.1 hypothetical protein [Alteromonadaceae bacterium]QCF26473.1 hypothetical protein soil367_11295 [Hydrocarboniclastica marina]
MSGQDLQEYRRQYDDEISLVDLARVLIRRRYWILGTFLVCVLGALAFALTKERQYTYTTSILIGEFGLDKYVATATGAKSVLESRVVPVVEREFVDKRDLESIPFRTQVNADEGNSFVNLRSEAPEDGQSLVADFHAAMAQALTSDHSDKLSLLERESSIRLDNLRASLATQEEQLKSLKALLVQLGQTTTQLQNEGDVTANAQSAADGMKATLSSSSNALTLVLSQLQLSEQLAKRESKINELQGEIEEEELKRSWIKPTRVVNIATASISPSGTGRSLILIIGAMLGLMFGVFLAFLVEFVGRVRSNA